MTAILCKKKVGVTRGRVTSSGLPPPLMGIGLDAIVKKLYHLLEKQILHHKLEKNDELTGVSYIVFPRRFFE